MADEEAEQDRGERSDTSSALNALSTRLEDTVAALKNSPESPDESASQYCFEFCQTLVEYVNRWSIEEGQLSVLEVYIIALLSFSQACPYLSAQCEKVPVVLERLSLSCAELLISLPQNVPDSLWDRFKSSVQIAHSLVQEKGITQLVILNTIAKEQGVWTNSMLQCILKNDTPPQEKVHEFLTLEGPALLKMRVKHLIKESCIEQAALLAKACAEFSEFVDQGHFKQMYLVCLCTVAPQELVMEELSRVDCQDALEMICNLEADGDEKAAFTLCSGFLTRQILQEDSYCAWELTLFWGKLLKRLESSEQGFLDRCRQMSLLSKTVFHLLFFVKVIQSEMDKVGLSACIDLCIRALRMESCDGSTKATVCKTISCLLPTDLEIKRACQLTEFLLEPTVDSYYAVETLYNEPDQKLEEEDLPVPNSLRCELLLVLKTQWPFDPEFWDWKALKRHCLGLMGEEASIVCSIDELNDGDPEGSEEGLFCEEFKDVTQRFLDATNELNEIADQKQKNREVKKLREKGFVSARFRNWQAYMQYCVLCDKEFLGHRIVRHAQTHFKDGYYSCPICVETFDARETLDPHVASHVKLSCKERLAAMKTTKKLANPKTAAPVIVALKAKSGENQVRKTKTKNNYNRGSIFNGNANDSDCLDFNDGNEGNICPVHGCRKGFKYFCNLIAHVKDHGDNEEAKRFLEMQSTKVVCQYCRRQFVSVDHLNDHLQVHCGIKPYICIQLNCKASFDTNAELIIHNKDHPVFKAKCMFPGCGKIFHEAYKLYDHEAQHYQTFTCKAPDCGKVFHSYSELDLHAEVHVAKVECQSTDGQIIEQTELQPDHTNQVHQGSVQHSPLSFTQMNTNSTGSQMDRGMVIVKHSVENMLNSAFAMSAQGCVHPGTCKPDQEAQSPIHQHIPQTNDHLTQSAMGPHLSHLNQFRPEESLLDALMNDSDPMPSTSSYQSVLDEFLPVPTTDVLHGQMQTVDLGNDNNNDLFGQYNPNPLGQSQTHYPSLCSNTMMPSTQASHCATQLVSLGQVLPPISQTLPLQMTPLPTNGQISDNKSVQPVDVNSAVQVMKERHKCQFESCTRDYSSYRSVTKHMKAVHPEFYTLWKLAKKNKVAVQPTLRSVSMNGSLKSVLHPQDELGQRVPGPGVQTQNPLSQPPSYPTSCANPSFPSVPSHITAPTEHAHTNEMANILDPIVLSQLGNTNQSQIGVDHLWDPRNDSVLQKQTCNSPGSAQNIDSPSSSHYSHLNIASSESAPHGGMSYTSLKPQNNPNSHPTPAQVDSICKQNDSTSDSLHSVANLNPPQQVMSPNMMGAVNSVAETNLGSTQMSALPSCTDSSDLKDSSVSTYSQQTSSLKSSVPKDASASSYPHQTNNSSFSAITHTPCVVKLERNPCVVPPLPNSGTSPSNRSFPASQNNTGNVSSDGDKKKVKRSRRTKWPAIIKDGKFICCRCYREFPSSKSLGGHLSKRASCKPFDEADLTADLPSSFLDLLNSPHPTPSSYVDLETSVHLPNKGPLDPKLYPNVTFPQANSSTYTSSDKLTGGVFKQNPSNRSMSCGQEQQTVPNTCQGPSAQSRLSETSVIQHTGNVKNTPQASYSDMSNPHFNDPLLSQLLAEDHSASTLYSCSLDHVSQILQAETLNKIKEIKEKTAIINASGLSNDGLLAAMESLAQNLVSGKSVKDRLRDQILAGDLHKKSNLPHGSSVDSSCSQMSVASPVTVDPQHSSNMILSAPPSEQGPVGNTAGTSTEIVLQLGNVSPNESLLHTQSSVSSGTTVNNATIITVDEILEIQKALEKLDLDREINEETRTVDDRTRNDRQPIKPESSDSSIEIPCFVKPFACDANGCTYRAMTKDAIFKHLFKLHNYTDDMLTQLKGQFNVAPFSCHKCSKAFTRNSNLKAHYQTVHNFTKEEIKMMKIKRQSNHRVLESDRRSTRPMPELPNPVKNASYLDVCQQQIYVPGASVSMKVDKAKLSHCITPGILADCWTNPEVRGLSLGMQTGSLQNHTPVQPSVIVSGYSSVSPRMDQQPNGWFSTKSSVSSQIHAFPLKELLPMPPLTPNPSTPVQVANESLDKYPKLAKPRVARPRESPKKTKDRKAEADDTFSPYRPYRCVHQGCVAAFTIQHNLILHYKAVHQSALPKFEVNNQDEQIEEEAQEQHRNEESENKMEGDFKEVVEFMCQVKNCSCIFQSVPDLLQHYLQLHKLTLEKAGAMMCSINLGRFQCDQPECYETFTAFWKYISHVDQEHTGTTISQVEPVEGMFRCQVEGCECAYSTRSNLLRHTMKKHQDIYKRMLINPRESKRGIKIGRPKKRHLDIIEKENRETNKKPVENENGSKKPVENEKSCKKPVENEKSCKKSVENEKSCKKPVENVKSCKKSVQKTEKENQENNKKPVQKTKENRETNKKPVQKDEKENNETNKKPVQKGEKENNETNKKPVQKDEKDNNETNKKPVQKGEKENNETNKKPVQKGEKENRETNKKKIQKGEKENSETYKKLVQKGGLKKRREKKNNWTKYGKPILKTQEEASAMCTKRLQLQYACMIKGCETVTSSERNIMKHYLQHGLPKQYLEEQRSNFIYCKKIPRSRYKRIASRSDDTDKSEESTISETSDNEEFAETGQSESDFSKPTSEKESTEDPDLSDCKPSTDTCSEISVVVKRKRGRPRKGEGKRAKSFGNKRMTRVRSVNDMDLNSESTSSSTTMNQEDVADQITPLNSFKPMGFEVSFLQFLQESRTSQKRKAKVQLSGSSRKRTTAFHLKTATVVCKRSDVKMHSREVLQLVEFKNPQNLSTLSNVTFEVQKVFSDVSEVLLKQLHEMRPMVILQKDD
ncbi:zinc finger protein 292-like [Xyrauchen texanus]|uniref:zinc finger protein 292-like n=1 Tax=Xyrauchen texanus TaxID=154827 RepID=UPI0022421E25|nr:zinc finger protein 292-like [Xyrauchen texanus]